MSSCGGVERYAPLAMLGRYDRRGLVGMTEWDTLHAVALQPWSV